VPAPVVGGCLIAIVLAAADGFANTRVSFDMTLKDTLLLIFFTTVGLAADARMLAKGGPRLFKASILRGGQVIELTGKAP
jgi:glutamate:Na+ symporter, ESS family